MTALLRWTPMILALAGAVLVGCEPVDGPAGDATAPSPARDQGSSSRHRRSPGVIVVTREAEEAFLAAMKRARETAADARRRWVNAGETQRDRWAIKWAAPTVGGAVEYVWVQPVSWTVDRIEGLLRSSPRRELLCGKGLGDMVGLPADELVDWVCYVDDAPSSGHDGGFTMDVIDELEH